MYANSKYKEAKFNLMEVEAIIFFMMRHVHVR